MAIHPLVYMDEFIDGSGQGRWFLAFHAIFLMHIQPVYTVFVRHGNPMNHRHWLPPSMNSSMMDTGGWIALGLWGI
jgi:hypothetical protein